MKFLKFLSLFVAAGFIFTSCQKELSFEDANAIGTLKYDATGDCMPSVVNGLYKKDTVLKATNYIDVQVNITATGAYDIKTDTVNGYSFRGRGETAVLGLNTIRLTGSGKPLVGPSTDIFTVNFDTSHCEVNVNVTVGATAPTAVFSLGGAPGACTGAVLSGTYTSGIATSTTANFVTLGVTVATPGTYSISTITANGVSFTGSGTFASTGVTSVILYADGGTPANSTTPVTTNYTMLGTGGCSFDVTYAATPPPATYTINCAGASVAGTYTAGATMTSANTVTISATSTSAGSYSITATANGVTFTGGGTFGSATTQPIILTASGTASATAGTYPFVATAATGGSTCTFSITFTAAPAATDFITASVNGMPTTTFNMNINASIDNSTGFPILDFSGDGTGSEFFELTVARTSGGSFGNGQNYNTNMFATGIFMLVSYTDGSATDYSAQTDGTIQTSPFNMSITTITTNRITGTFSGTVKDDATGAITKTFTNGQFSVPY